jgi:hypothetical protein
MNKSRKSVWATVQILSALLAFVVTSTAGCGSYGEISPAAYDYATALYSISNQKAKDKLVGIGEQIKTARESGDLSQQEAEWLEAILSDSCNGKWESAVKACRAMMEDQVDN